MYANLLYISSANVTFVYRKNIIKYHTIHKNTHNQLNHCTRIYIYISLSPFSYYCTQQKPSQRVNYDIDNTTLFSSCQLRNPILYSLWTSLPHRATTAAIVGRSCLCLSTQLGLIFVLCYTIIICSDVFDHYTHCMHRLHRNRKPFHLFNGTHPHHQQILLSTEKHTSSPYHKCPVCTRYHISFSLFLRCILCEAGSGLVPFLFQFTSVLGET